jgi:hypothetical protein
MSFLCCSMYFYVVLCIVCFVTFSVLFACICVLYYCHRVATQLQLNISCTVSYKMIVFCHETICDMCCSSRSNFLKSTFIVSTDLPRANCKNLVISLWEQFENPWHKANNLIQTSDRTNFRKLHTNNMSVWTEARTAKTLSLQTDDLIWKTHNENFIFMPN